MSISSLVYQHFVLGRGDRGPGVQLLQQVLYRLGYEVPQNGEFEEQTTAAVRKFQGAKDLEENGLVNVETAAALDAEIHKRVAEGRDASQG